MEVYIINMNRSPEKWTRCSQRFRDKGFRVFRQEGYDVRNWDLSMYNINHAQRTNYGMLGCGISHRTIWEKSFPQKDFLIVAEDDAIPLVSSQVFMDQISKMGNIDFLHFGCGSRCSAREPFIGTHCYLVTRQGAEKFAAHWKNRIDVPIDTAIGETPGLRLAHSRVPCATSEKRTACTSDITNTRNKLACALDRIPLYNDKTLGYFLFYPYFGYFNIHDVLLVAIIMLLVIKKC